MAGIISSQKPGLYDELISLARQTSLELGDPRLAEVAEVDAEESHILIAQFLEHAIAGVLGRFSRERCR